MIRFCLESGIHQIHRKNFKNFTCLCTGVCEIETEENREAEVEREKRLVKTWFPNYINANVQI